MSLGELQELVEGLEVDEFLSRRARAYRELRLEQGALSRSEILNLIVKEPTLLRRPIVVSGRRKIVGFDREALEALG